MTETTTQAGHNTNQRSLIIATAGHVDHGKSSLVNKITGTNTDTLREEKERGLSINLGYAYYNLPATENDVASGYVIGFVDVPGHADFINNMLAGVGTVDYALLVIAADDGIMPQTREHLSILDLLGISKGVIALTKTDKCNAQQITEVSGEITELLSSTCLKKAPIFPVSSLTGEGLDTLLEFLQNTLRETKSDEALQQNHNPRFLIDRSFSVKGIGTVVTGSLRSGKLHVGDSMLHSGTRQKTKIRGLRLGTANIKDALAGQRAAANIGIDQNSITRGDWLLAPEQYVPVQRFDAKIRFISPDFKLRSSAQYHLYIGAAHHIVSIRCLNVEPEKFFQVASHQPFIAYHGDKFIIRDPSSQLTLGGGKVIDIFVPRRKRNSDERLNLLRAQNNPHSQALIELINMSPMGVPLEQFSLNRNLTKIALDKIIKQLRASENFFVELQLNNQQLPSLLKLDFYLRYKEFIVAQIDIYHHNHSSKQGISEANLSKTVDFSGSHLLFHAILKKLILDEVLRKTGTLLHLPSHEIELSKDEKEFLAKIRPLLIQAGTIPPRTRELADITGISLKTLERILKEITVSGSLIKVAENRHFLPETIMELAELTEQLAEDNPNQEGFSVIQFRDASHIGRNLCIEILEYFDRIGFTRRDGNTRYVRTEKKNIFSR